MKLKRNAERVGENYFSEPTLFEELLFRGNCQVQKR